MSTMVPCSRPSSMKGIFRYSSSIARQAPASNGFFSIGSRTPLSPTLLTRTSLPSKRNYFGRRTPWLLPCMNSLAVGLLHRLLPKVRQHPDVRRRARRMPAHLAGGEPLGGPPNVDGFEQQGGCRRSLGQWAFRKPAPRRLPSPQIPAAREFRPLPPSAFPRRRASADN